MFCGRLLIFLDFLWVSHFHFSFIQTGRTALLAAAEAGHTDCVRLLLEAGADTEAKDKVR